MELYFKNIEFFSSQSVRISEDIVTQLFDGYSMLYTFQDLVGQKPNEVG